MIRLAARLRYGAPPLPADLPEPIKLGAHLSHYALYVLMIAMPLLGLTMQWTDAYPIVLYGDIRLPTLAPQSDAMHTLLWDAHFYLAFAFFVVILLHVAAACFTRLSGGTACSRAWRPRPRTTRRSRSGRPKPSEVRAIADRQSDRSHRIHRNEDDEFWRPQEFG